MLTPYSHTNLLDPEKGILMITSNEMSTLRSFYIQNSIYFPFALVHVHFEYGAVIMRLGINLMENVYHLPSINNKPLLCGRNIYVCMRTYITNCMTNTVQSI